MTVNYGSHMGAVHSWIQHKPNGDMVKWGSDDLVAGTGMTVRQLEELAQEVRDAVLREFHVKDHDHQWSFTVVSSGGCAAFQDCDTYEEMWAALFQATGDVVIYHRTKNNKLGKPIFRGLAHEARAFVYRNAKMGVALE